MQKTLRVTGTGAISLAPDTTVLRIELRGNEKEYDRIVRSSSADLKIVKKAIFDLGFEEKALKNIDYDIRPEYEGKTDKKGNYKREFIGYRYTREMKLTFPKDGTKLGEVMMALMKCGVDPELSLNYTISDTESAKNLLLEKAVADCRAKAQALARGAGVELGEILSIDYSFMKISFETEMLSCEKASMCMGAEPDELDFDLDPEDIDIRDNVTVIYEIK